MAYGKISNGSRMTLKRITAIKSKEVKKMACGKGKKKK